jgi:hypothetical protein
MLILIPKLSIEKYQSKFLNVAIWEHCIHCSQNFGSGKIYYSNSVTIPN